MQPLLQQTAESYFYVPDLGQVPEIDVPSYLPDLPGIADDLSYSADLGPGFAPSGPASLLPELPSFADDNTPGTNNCDFSSVYVDLEVIFFFFIFLAHVFHSCPHSRFTAGAQRPTASSTTSPSPCRAQFRSYDSRWSSSASTSSSTASRSC